MYAKLFASLYQGTLRGCADEILVFTNLMAHADSTGVVDKHWRAISEEVGISRDRVEAAIRNLEAPDIESRSPEEGGRRIVRLDEHRVWGWRIVNYGKYRSIRSEDDRREQNRLAQERWRNKQNKPRKPRSAQAEAEAKAEERKNIGANAPHPSALPAGFDRMNADCPGDSHAEQTDRDERAAMGVGRKAGDAHAGRPDRGDSGGGEPSAGGTGKARRAGNDAHGIRLPADWQPGPAERAFATEHGHDADEVAPRFRDYWHGVAGAKGRKADWPATWRNWIRRDNTGGAALRGRSNGAARSKVELVEEVALAFERMEAKNGH